MSHNEYKVSSDIMTWFPRDLSINPKRPNKYWIPISLH